ncbi:MBL fold metallo-hydrolase [Niallia sp. 01092]|uniref:MBL fold metallo-hydrolase n=1 Tax=unclassified Niallia TaxID=2837522 RepID=UPI003FCF2082
MLHFIGCGSAFNTQLGNNAAFIKKGNSLFLIDCGSSTFERFQRSGLLKGVEQVYILLTHTHPDHVGSLGDLIFFGYYVMGNLAEPSVTVLAPNKLKIQHLLKGMGVEENIYTFIPFEKNGRIRCNDFHLQYEAVSVTHVKELSCFGYIIHFENKTIYYSGDANSIPPEILDRLHDGEFDFFYQDTCKADYKGNVHLSLRKLNELVTQEFRDKVYCMHLDEGFKKAEANKLGFHVVKSII